MNFKRIYLFCSLCLAVLLSACTSDTAKVESADFELSYWMDMDCVGNHRRGYWEDISWETEPETPEIYVKNTVHQLAETYKANKLYVIYHRQYEVETAKKVFGYWKKYGDMYGLEIVPTIVAQNYDRVDIRGGKLNFTDEELEELCRWCMDNIREGEVGIYDVYTRDQEGSLQDIQLGNLSKTLGNVFILVGMQPGVSLRPYYKYAVQDTWTAECQGLTNELWAAPEEWKGSRNHGRNLLVDWVKERTENPADTRVWVWDLIPVAWDYDEEGLRNNPYSYDCPGDNSKTNDPPLPGRLALCEECITACYAGGYADPRFGGYSCDLHILQANSAGCGRDELPFYEAIREGKRYTGYFASAMDDIAVIYENIAATLNAEKTIYFVGESTNDLYEALLGNNVAVKLYDSLDAALADASRGQGIVVTASGYPGTRTEITAENYAAVAEKDIRLFVEYPSHVEGVDVSKTHDGRLERGVVTSSAFGEALPAMSILGINGVRIIDMEFPAKTDVWMSFAKVAGFDYAQFGLEGTDVYPLLAKLDKNVLVATSRISSFKTGRFAPVESWRIVMDNIVRWLAGSQSEMIEKISADPVPSYSKDEPLPANARKNAVKRGAEWLWNANLFIHPTWAKDYISQYQPVGGNPNHYFGPPVSDDMLQGDGSFGVMEGHASEIYADGNQKYRYFIRADVQGEAAMLLASASKTCGGNEKYEKTAENILDYLFYTSEFRDGPKNDKESAVYGLIGWANTHLWAFFNDDNARCILGAIGASSQIDNQRWNKEIVENIFANLRTCSRQGFQGGSINEPDIIANGWQWYNRRDYINPSGHFESWMWACYLWLYDKCGYEPLLRKAKNGLQVMMDTYPDKWYTQNGLQQERARMVLPLAWLYRLEPTQEHYDWLATIVNELLAIQEPFGAIKEEIGRSGQDRHKLLVTSNDAYGKNEAPLIAKNGDPVSDMLYTCNFLFFGLNEAAQATGNAEWKDAVTRLGDFLVRIQVKSENHKDVDGAWFRAFDFGRWDYWASNADDGWGAWCTLAGWIQAWIVSTESLLDRNTSYWEETKNMNMTEAVQECQWMVEDIDK